MVWQVREKQNCNFVNRENDNDDQLEIKTSKSTTPSPQPSQVKTEVESRSSRDSRASTCSVDLGPAPGSGLVTVDASETSDNEIKLRRTPSFGLEMTESMTTSSLLQFNRDVESMLENDEPPEPEPGEPNEDFTQHYS